jgi:hypothetical protein
MTAVNCPMCVLRFSNKNERDWHLDHEHHHPHVHAPTERKLAWSRPVRVPAPGGPAETDDADQGPSTADSRADLRQRPDDAPGTRR